MAYAQTHRSVTLFVIAILVLASPLRSFAQATSVANSSALSEKHETSTQSSVGILTSLSRTRSLIDHQDGTLKESLDVLLNPTATVGKYSFAAKTVYSRDLRNSEGSDWSDTALSVSREFASWRTKQLAERKFTMSLLSSLPTSKVSSVKQSLMGSAGIGSSLVFLPKNAEYGVTMALGLSLSKLFHRYDTAVDGTVNNSVSSNQSLLVNIQMGSFSLGGEFVHKVRQSYQGTNKNAFEHTEEFGYAINPHFIVAIGHSNAGAVQKLSGDNNIQLIDENESIIYSSLTMSY